MKLFRIRNNLIILYFDHYDANKYVISFND